MSLKKCCHGNTTNHSLPILRSQVHPVDPAGHEYPERTKTKSAGYEYGYILAMYAGLFLYTILWVYKIYIMYIILWVYKIYYVCNIMGI